jgi:hypothetical protein
MIKGPSRADLKGALSLTFAVSMAAVGALIMNLKLGEDAKKYVRPSWTIITIGVVMDMSQRERMLVKSTLRAIGTLVGGILGMGVVLIAEVLAKSGATEAQINKSPGASMWLLTSVSLLCFLNALFMRMFKENAYIFHLASITLLIVGYSNDVEAGVWRLASVVVGILLSVISILLFNYEKANRAVLSFYQAVVRQSLIFMNNALKPAARAPGSGPSAATMKAVTAALEGLTVNGLSVMGTVRARQQLKGTSQEDGCVQDVLLERVRCLLFGAEDALAARKRWRSWFRLRPEVEMDRVSTEIVNFYHECHNMYAASLNHSPQNDKSWSAGLFEDSDFKLWFMPVVDDIRHELVDVFAYQVDLLHNPDHLPEDDCVASLERIARLLVEFANRYTDHRDGFLEIKHLRWSVNALVISLAGCLVTLTMYVTAVLKVPMVASLDEETTKDMIQRLDRVRERTAIYIKSGPRVLISSQQKTTKSIQFVPSLVQLAEEDDVDPKS